MNRSSAAGQDDSALASLQLPVSAEEHGCAEDPLEGREEAAVLSAALVEAECV